MRAQDRAQTSSRGHSDQPPVLPLLPPLGMDLAWRLALEVVVVSRDQDTHMLLATSRAIQSHVIAVMFKVAKKAMLGLLMDAESIPPSGQSLWLEPPSPFGDQ